MKRDKQITRDDVAEEAKVSSATVSRVFNNPSSVAPKRRDAVLRAAEKLGYSPNKSASALRRSGSGIITLLSFEKKERPYYWGNQVESSWFYGEIVQNIAAELEHTMYTLNLKKRGELSDIDTLNLTTDGIICYDIDSAEEIEAVESLKIPFVIAHHTSGFPGPLSCSTDNVKGGMLQGQYLRSHKASKPLYCVNFLDTVYPNRERLQGFMKEWNGTQPHIVNIDPSSRASIPEEIIDLILDGTYDSIASVNDVTLLTLLNAVTNRGGKSILETMVLCGYDDIPMRSFLPYTFASVDIRPGEIYRKGTQLLLSHLGQSPSLSSLTVQPHLVIP